MISASQEEVQPSVACRKKENAMSEFGCMQKEGIHAHAWRCATNGRMKKKQDVKKHMHMMSKEFLSPDLQKLEDQA